MFTYSFSKEPVRLGEHDPKYGSTWWAEVTEHLEPVKFNIMSVEPIDVRDQIECEERTQKRTAKGKDYFQLKRVKVHKAFGQPQTQAQPAAAPAQVPQVSNSQLDRIEKQLSLILEGINDLKGIDRAPEDPWSQELN